MKVWRFIIPAFLLLACSAPKDAVPYDSTVSIPMDVLKDKIRGGWYAQTIGCTYGGPTEFKFKGGLMQDSQLIPWSEDYILETFIEDPGLYDDVYMDLTFLEVMCRHGIDAPALLYAESFANADYKLWHANQAARYNILNGVLPPHSGHWMNNPHADDIDFQIEADFIGMLWPGMPDRAVATCDRIGHIMNYGDGYYGGVFVSVMYSLAFVCDDMETIVREAASVIPQGSKFRDCIEDVLYFHEKYPTDWKQCWFEIDKRHSFDIGCPEGVWNGFNIDAVINAAYIVIGLLYGEGDFERTMDIATRCGQDSDCNPASAAGVLGVVKGYDAIPEKYRLAASKIADEPFPYTTLSLEETCVKNLELLQDAVRSAGGKVGPDGVELVVTRASVLPWEQSFEGLVPVAKVVLKKRFSTSLDLDFTGNSIVVEGSVVKTGHSTKDYVARLEASIDGVVVEEFDMPYDYIKRKYEVFSKYCLSSGHHRLTLRLLNPDPDFEINAQEMVVYDSIEKAL